MSPQKFAQIMTYFSIMPDSFTPWPTGDSKNDEEKRKLIWSTYDTVMHYWSDELADKVIEYVKVNCEWRPRPANLAKLASEIVCPLPSVTGVTREILDMINTRGVNTNQIPGRHLWLRSDKAPKFSSPFVDDVVSRLSRTYVDLCDLPQKEREPEVRRCVELAYSEVKPEWSMSITDNLRKPEQQREMRYTPVSPYPFYRRIESKPISEATSLVVMQADPKDVQRRLVRSLDKTIEDSSVVKNPFNDD